MASEQLSRVMDALKKADAEGNTEDATKLAEIARRLSNQEQAGGGTEPQSQEDPAPNLDTIREHAGTTTNPVYGMADRAVNLAGNLVDAVSAGRQAYKDAGLPRIAEVIGLGGVSEALDKGTASAAKSLAETEAEMPDFKSSAAGSARSLVDGNVTMGTVGGTLQEGAEAIITSLPDMVGATLPPTIIPYFMSRTQEMAEQRAKNDNRKKITKEDYMAAGTAAIGSVALERVGAKGVFSPKSSSLGGKLTEASVKEGGTEGIQSGIEQAGTEIGTEAGRERGLDIVNRAKDAAADALIGAGAGGTGRTTAAAAKVTVDTAKYIKDRASEAGLASQYESNPDVFVGLVRTHAEFEREKQQLTASSPSGKSVDDSIVFRNLRGRYAGDLEQTVGSLYDAGVIDKDELKVLDRSRHGAIQQSDNTQRSLNPDVVFPQIDAMEGLSEGQARLLKDALIDLDIVSHSSVFSRGRGPFEKLSSPSQGSARMLLGGAGGFAAGGPAGALAGTAGAAALPYVGRKIDGALGLNKPMALSRAKARVRVAQRQGAEVRNTRKDLASETMSQEAKIDNSPVYIPKAKKPARTNAQELNSKLQKFREKHRVQAGGGWRNEIASYLNANSGIKVSNADLETTLQELVDDGALSASQAAMATLPGAKLRRPLYYLINDRTRDRLQAQSGTQPQPTSNTTSDQVAEVNRIKSSLGSAGSSIPEVNDKMSPAAVKKALSYAQTMENVRNSTDNAVDNAPSPELAQGALEVASAKTKAEKRKILNRLISQYPAHAAWLQQFVLPLTQFGPSENTSSGQNSPAVTRARIRASSQ